MTPADGQSPTPAPPPLIEAAGIVKRFGDLLANDHVDLSVAPGEIHALLGENGAGKSTLVKILYGLLQPDAGEIRMDGDPITIAGPADARARGIGMVFQHFSLFEALTVAENIALALPPEHTLKGVTRRVREVAAEYGLHLDPDAPVHALSVGERQRVEIVRCLLQNPRLLILDEPTAVLTPQEADRLFVVLERLSGEGRSILYISHRLVEVQRLCHRATVLRGGRVVGRVDPRKETAASLAALMVGRNVREARAEHGEGAGPVRLAARGLELPAETLHGVALKDLSLEVRAGEIFAIAGVAGNGQSELFAALSGERLAPTAEMVALDGRPVGRAGVTARRALGAAFVPEERLGHAAAPGLRLSENAVLTKHGRKAGLVRSGFVDLARALGLAERISGAYDVRKGARDPVARSLSGGNLQKFVVGRELVDDPSVLVVNQPTWGVDAGAAAAIREQLIGLARRGAAVLVISQDLDEILAIADRVAVIHAGLLSRPEPAATVDIQHLGLLMGGAAPELPPDQPEFAHAAGA